MRLSLPRRLLASALVLALAAPAIAAVPAVRRLAVDVTGNWAISVNTPQGATESTVTFDQKGDSVTGVITMDRIGTRNLVGTVTKDTLRFGFTIDMQGQVMEIRAGGIVKDSVTIDGELVLPGGMGAFTFVAKKQK